MRSDRVTGYGVIWAGTFGVVLIFLFAFGRSRFTRFIGAALVAAGATAIEIATDNPGTGPVQ